MNTSLSRRRFLPAPRLRLAWPVSRPSHSADHVSESRRPSVGFRRVEPVRARDTIYRRCFLSGTAATGAGLLILRHSASAWSYQANEKLNIALIGLGVRGGSHHVNAFPRIGENLVALCDVNDKQLEGPAKLLPAARKYRDFRKTVR